MSDSVSSAKVEDVLASIRRLVSEERRPFGAAGPVNGKPMASTAATEARVDGDRLILTPSLRVSGPDPKSLDVRVADDRVDSEEDTDQLDLRRTTNGIARHNDSSTSEDLTDVLRLDETVRLPGVTAAGQETRTDPAPSATDDVTREASRQPVDAAAGSHKPETRGGARSEADAEHTGAPDPLLVRDLHKERAPGDMPGDEESGDAGAEVSSKPLLLEPDDRSDGTAAESDPNPASSDGSAAGPAEPVSVAHALGDADLRVLVSDIVRQELSGELGERITRNVRKLVRREIQRALAMKDLE